MNGRQLTHILAAATVAFTAPLAVAQSAPASAADSAADHAAHLPATAAVSQSDGEVRKIDKEQGKVTLRHGPLANLDMPAMTMVFKVADSTLIEGLKEGDKVKFRAEKMGGAFVVTAIQVAQ